jgi:hypothetical protein
MEREAAARQVQDEALQAQEEALQAQEEEETDLDDADSDKENVPFMLPLRQERPKQQ